MKRFPYMLVKWSIKLESFRLRYNIDIISKQNFRDLFFFENAFLLSSKLWNFLMYENVFFYCSMVFHMNFSRALLRRY